MLTAPLQIHSSSFLLCFLWVVFPILFASLSIQLSVSLSTFFSFIFLICRIPGSRFQSAVVCMSWLWLLWILSCNRQRAVLVSDVCVTCFLPEPISSSLPAFSTGFSGLVPARSNSGLSLHRAANFTISGGNNA